MKDTVMPAQEQQTYSERIQSSYGEVFESLKSKYATSTGVKGILSGMSQYTASHSVRSIAFAGASGLAILASLQNWGLGVTVAQGAGIVGFLLARESATFNYHRHILATASMSVLFSTTQQAVMAGVSSDVGAYLPGMFMLAHAGVTLGAFSVVPEDRKILRNAITWGGGFASAAAAAWTATEYSDSSGYIPAVTTLANSVLFSANDNDTPRARLGYLVANVSHAFYWATQPVASVALIAAESVYAVTHAVSIVHNDMPYQNEERGDVLTVSERLKEWTSIVFGGREKGTINKTKHDLDMPRPDDLLYQSVSTLVLGK